MALLTSYETLTATTSLTIGNANIQSNGELTGTSANISGNIILDGGPGVIGPDADNLLISWNNEDIVVRSVAGRVEVEADGDFSISTNYDPGNALYSSRWVVTNNNIVNISGNAAIVSEAGNLTLSGGQDGINSGNTTISAVNLGNAVYNWGFNNTGKLAIAGPSYANSSSNIYTSLNTGIALQPSWNQGGAGPTFLQGPGLDLHWNDGLFLTVSDGDYAQSEGNTSTVPFTISGPVTANGSVPVGALAITGGTNGTANGDVNIGTSQTSVVRVKNVTFSSTSQQANITTAGGLNIGVSGSNGGGVDIYGAESANNPVVPGGGISIYGGAASGTSVEAGGINIEAGSGADGTVNGGDVYIAAGSAANGTPGVVDIIAGSNNAGNRGNINFFGNIQLGAVANVHITGGTNGQVLTTDGAGNLSFTTVSGGGNATPAGSNTQVQFNNAGAFGASSGLTFDNTSGNLNVSGGFVNAAAVQTTGRIEVGTNLNVNGLTTLGAVANVSITGGSNGQFLRTDGAGNLSFANVALTQLSNANAGFALQSDGTLLTTSSGSATNFVVNPNTPDVDLRNASGTGSFTQGANYTIRTAGTNNWVFDNTGNLSVPGSITANAVFTKLTTSTNSNATVTVTSQLTFINNAGATTVTMPAASANTVGQVFYIKDTLGANRTGNAITIQGAGSDTIDGGNVQIISPYNSVTIVGVTSTSWGVL